jgi:hypothetical protein
MTEYSLYPCAIQYNYRSQYAPHKMTIPLNAWSPASSGHLAGTNLAWDGTQKDTADLVGEFVTLMKPFFHSSTTFTDYVVYTYADEDAPARPVVSDAITGGAGTGAATIPATQASMMFKTTVYGTFKLVLLDTKVSAAFGPLSPLVSPANDIEIAVVDHLKSTGNPYRGRDNHQIANFVKVTYTLNEKLRKSYRLD